MFNKLFSKNHSPKRYRYIAFGLMLLGGIAALIAAFVLTLDKFAVLENPNTILSCSVNIVLDCSTVMRSWQAHVFGFPNMLIGLMAFPMLIMIAVLGLSGLKFPRWFSISSTIALFLGLVFSYWLFFNSVYAIQVLCPWCLVVTAAMTVMFASYMHVHLKENNFALKDTVNAKVQRFLKGGYHQTIVLAWMALMVVLIFLKFGQALFA